MLAGHERGAGDARVVAGARRFEIGEEGRVVDVTERVGVNEADLDRVLVVEFTAERLRSAAHVRRMLGRRPGLEEIHRALEIGAVAVVDVENELEDRP